MTQKDKQEKIQILEEAIKDGTWTLENLYNERYMFDSFLQDYIVERIKKL